MRQWDQEYVHDLAADGVRPSDLVLTSVEFVHDHIVHGCRARLLGDRVVHILCVGLFEFLGLLRLILNRFEQVLAHYGISLLRYVVKQGLGLLLRLIIFRAVLLLKDLRVGALRHLRLVLTVV